MPLAQFIVENMDNIMRCWEEFAATIPHAARLDPSELRDHAEKILRAIAAEMSEPQTRQERDVRSKGGAVRIEGADDTAAETHGADRLAEGFDLNEMMSEYRALRASVIRLWTQRMPGVAESLEELTRFNEGIDQAVAESVARYSANLDRSREMVLGALGHDLRTPLGAVILSARYLLDAEQLSGNQSKAASRIMRSGTRMQQMISELLDLAQTRLGGSLPLNRTTVDAAEICHEAVEETTAFHPDRVVNMELSGNLTGTWDRGRVSQILSNLLDNAVRHGTPGTPVSLTAEGLPDEICVKVHNLGPTIPAAVRHHIFEPLVHSGSDSRDSSPHRGLGLGLYIACAITRAHRGSISVTSEDEQGTTFTLRLPRRPPAPKS